MSAFSSIERGPVSTEPDFDGRWLGGPTLPNALLAPLMAAPLAMAVLDQDGVVIGWNEFATILLGWTPRDVIGTKIEAQLLPARFVSAYCDIIAARPSDDASIATRCFAIGLLNRRGDEVDVDVALASSLDVGRLIYVVYAWPRTAGAAIEGPVCRGVPAPAPIQDFRTHVSIDAGQTRYSAGRVTPSAEGAGPS